MDSQSITLKDARTQPKEERINTETDKQSKDVPIYPEPQGEPSY